MTTTWASEKKTWLSFLSSPFSRSFSFFLFCGIAKRKKRKKVWMTKKVLFGCFVREKHTVSPTEHFAISERQKRRSVFLNNIEYVDWGSGFARCLVGTENVREWRTGEERKREREKKVALLFTRISPFLTGACLAEKWSQCSTLYRKKMFG